MAIAILVALGSISQTNGVCELSRILGTRVDKSILLRSTPLSTYKYYRLHYFLQLSVWRIISSVISRSTPQVCESFGLLLGLFGTSIYELINFFDRLKSRLGPWTS